MSLGVGLVSESTVSLKNTSSDGAKRKIKDSSRLLDEILHVVAPLHTRLVLESGRLHRR